MNVALQNIEPSPERVNYQLDPSRYRHWQVSYDGPVATVAMAVDEDGGLRPGYKMKLNSYDLGVDIEYHDVLQRIRFEHPEVRTIVLTSARERIFCSGANIYMLGQSSHAWKVNFCKFTNETRNGMEHSSAKSGLKFLAAVNGACAGGGYEVALACDEIHLVDDRSSTVSLPEVPLLGVLPGTGGLTRVTDKRKVRRDYADIFCTTSEGVRADRAKEWKLIDGFAKPGAFADHIKARALALAEQSDRPAGAKGVALTPLKKRIEADALRYETLDIELDRAARTATFNLRAPAEPPASAPADILAAGADWWPLKFARELDDAILELRTNELDLGLWLFKSSGSAVDVLAADEALLKNRDNWFVRETLNMIERTFARLDVSSRTMFTIIDEGSCFSGLFFEFVLAADRSYMLELPEGEGPTVTLSEINFGALGEVNGISRILTHFSEDEAPAEAARRLIGKPLDAVAAREAGLVTLTPDDIDWADEIRLAIEERASLSPDALTGMEANLRFGGRETMLTRVFGRLSAWQNWIFIRPNAVGPDGALKKFGTGARAAFDWNRV